MSDQEREPSGVKVAPKAVVGRVSLYLRQLEAYQRQGGTTVSSSGSIGCRPDSFFSWIRMYG